MAVSITQLIVENAQHECLRHGYVYCIAPMRQCIHHGRYQAHQIFDLASISLEFHDFQHRAEILPSSLSALLIEVNVLHVCTLWILHKGLSAHYARSCWFWTMGRTICTSSWVIFVGMANQRLVFNIWTNQWSRIFAFCRFQDTEFEWSWEICSEMKFSTRTIMGTCTLYRFVLQKFSTQIL